MIISELFNLTLTDHISIFQKFEQSGLFEILWCEKLSEEARDSDDIYDFSISLKEGDFDDFVNAIYNVRDIFINSIDIDLSVNYGFAGQCNLWINAETLHKIGEMKLSLSISCYEDNDEGIEKAENKDEYMTEYESCVMQMLLDGDDPVLSVLREQYANSCIESKEYTGVGFYINFTIPESVPLVNVKQDFIIGDVFGDIEENTIELSSPQPGLGFILFIRNGYISTLEGYNTYGSEWPSDVNEYKLHYHCGSRDMNKLREEWGE